MSKRTVIARARFHIEQGLASLLRSEELYGFKFPEHERAKEWAEAALLSASSDPAAFWLLLKAGVDPLTPERAERALVSLRGGQS
jgi:hypothetical protein